MRAIAVCLAVSMIVGVARASAEPLRNPADARALEHLKLGNRHLDLERYDDAIEQYEAGALIDPVPVFWLNIGLAHRKAGRHEDAVRAYRTFVMKIADDPAGAELRVQVEEIIRAIEDAASKPPTEPGPALDPPPAVTAEPTPPRDAPTPPRGLSARRKAAIVVGVGGIVALGAGAGLGLRAKGFEDDAATLCPMTACARADEADALIERAETSATYANVAFGVGAVALVGAAVLWFTGQPGDEPRVTLSPQVSGTLAGVNVALRF